MTRQTDERCRERWTCPICLLEGQTNTAHPDESSLVAHMRLLHPDRDAGRYTPTGETR